jgi:hypothetical protein
MYWLPQPTNPLSPILEACGYATQKAHDNKKSDSIRGQLMAMPLVSVAMPMIVIVMLVVMVMRRTPPTRDTARNTPPLTRALPTTRLGITIRDTLQHTLMGLIVRATARPIKPNAAWATTTRHAVPIQMLMSRLHAEFRLDSSGMDAVGVKTAADRLGDLHVPLRAVLAVDGEGDLDVEGSNYLAV